MGCKPQVGKALSSLAPPGLRVTFREQTRVILRERRRYERGLDYRWLTRQGKLRDLQNRMGFVLQVAGVSTPAALDVVAELGKARLLAEATLCWDSMPDATREWMRVNRSELARSWNVLTMMRAEEVPDAG